MYTKILKTFSLSRKIKNPPDTSFIILILKLITTTLTLFAIIYASLFLSKYFSYNSLQFPYVRYRLSLVKNRTEKLHNDLLLINQVFSSDNRYLDKQEHNALLLPRAENIINEIEKNRNTILNDRLAEIINLAALTLDSMANHYSVSKADPETAEKLLLRAKFLIESQISINIARYNADNMYSALKKQYVKYPLTYARVLYSLGRNYFYTRDPAKLISSTIYLKTAQNIARIKDETHELMRIEAALSDITGLLRLSIESDNPTSIAQAIKKYKTYINDGNKYIDKGKIKILKDSKFHRAECNSKIAEGYRKLALINKNIEDKRMYFKLALTHILGGTYNNEEYEGTLNLIEPQSINTVNYYNLLGNVILLFPQDPPPPQIKQFAPEGINFSTNIDVAKYFFEKSIDALNNRDISYRTSDAYLGLANVFYQQGLYEESRDFAQKSIKLQIKIKRPLFHPSLVAAKNLLILSKQAINKSN